MAVEAGGIGTRLRAGREKLGLTVLQVAERLHTDGKIVEAIEADNFEALGAPVYARGHIRHYAELVGESGAELSALYSDLSKVAQPDLTRIVKVPAASDSSKLVAPALMVIAVFAIAGAIWWISALSKKKPELSGTHLVAEQVPKAVSGPEAVPPPEGPAPPGSAPTVAAPSTPKVTPGPTVTPAPSRAAAAAPTRGPTVGATAPTREPVSTPTRPTAATALTHVPAPAPTRAPAPVASPNRTPATAAPTRPPASVALPTRAPAPAAAPIRNPASAPTHAPAPASTAAASAAATSAAAPASSPPARPKNQAQVTLHYSADSWTEVYDASGARLFYDVGAANTVQTLSGTPPLRVVLGNASGVAVQFNGHNTSVAKLSQPDGSVQFSINRAGRVVRAKPAAGGG